MFIFYFLHFKSSRITFMKSLYYYLPMLNTSLRLYSDHEITFFKTIMKRVCYQTLHIM